MRHRKIRRLPVVDQSGRLMGIVSLHDIAAQARSSKGADVPADVVLDTYLAITVAGNVPVPA
jgi:CBS-domain-containing membrane protein